MPFTVKTEEKQIGVFTVFPTGSLDAGTSSVLQDRVDKLLDNAARVIVFDLRHLEFISSSGVRVFLVARKALQNRGGKLALINAQPQIQKVFEIIQALPSLNIFKDVEELDNYLASMQQSVLEGGEGDAV